MLSVPAIRAVVVPALAIALTASADWPNLGGNPARNGLTSAIGPATPTLRWSGAPLSLISWTPIVEGNRVFNIRQAVAQNPVVGPGDSILYALDLATGTQLWSYDFPWAPGDWTTALYGAKNGRVYAGRADDGLTRSSAIHCLDAATGNLLWVSACDSCAPGLYDGVVFTENGDLIAVAGYDIRRIDGDTGAVVWTAPHQFSITGSSGPALVGNSIYVHEKGPGNTVRVGCIDATTGAKRYASEAIPVFWTQTEVFAGSDGMVFFPVVPRLSPETDRLYAYEDTGSGLVLRWSAPCAAFGGEHGITADGGVIFVNYGGFLEIRDQMTGTLRATSAVSVARTPTWLTSPHIVIDGAGKIFFGNGGFPGTVFAFNPDLTLRWSIDVPNLNEGGPVLAGDGTLLIAGVGSDFRAYRDPSCVPADLDCDGTVNGDDLGILLGAWGPCVTGPPTCRGDLDGNGQVNGDDLGALLAAWG